MLCEKSYIMVSFQCPMICTNTVYCGSSHRDSPGHVWLSEREEQRNRIWQPMSACDTSWQSEWFKGRKGMTSDFSE